MGGFSVVVPHKCIQALQDKPLTGKRDERRRLKEEVVVWGVSRPVLPDACSKQLCDLYASLLERH